MKTILIKVLMVVIGVFIITADLFCEKPFVGGGKKSTLLNLKNSGNGNPNCLDFQACLMDDSGIEIIYPDVEISKNLNFSVGVPGINLPNMYLYVYLANLGFESPVFVSAPLNFVQNYDPQTGDYSIDNEEYIYFESITIDLGPYLSRIDCDHIISFGFSLVLENETGDYVAYNEMFPDLFNGLEVNIPVFLQTCVDEGEETDTSYLKMSGSSIFLDKNDLGKKTRASYSENNVRLHDIYPNPFYLDFTLSLFTIHRETVIVRILGMNGKEFFKKEYELEQGINFLHLDEIHLVNGIYILNVMGGGINISSRIMKN